MKSVPAQGDAIELRVRGGAWIRAVVGSKFEGAFLADDIDGKTGYVRNLSDEGWTWRRISEGGAT